VGPRRAVVVGHVQGAAVVLRRAIEAGARAGETVIARLAPRSEAAAQVSGLRETAHRPWPVAGRPWLQGQTWLDLLFAHWSLPVEALRPAVPPELPLDTFDGRAWLGITPFELGGLRLRGTPPVPGRSRFPETNVRTYTTVDAKPGIYFLSLDADSSLAVAGARLMFRLPYFRARMSIERVGGEVVYRSRRTGPDASLHVRFRPCGPVFHARPGTLEHFLTERYCLYTLDGRRHLHRAQIHHPPWLLQEAHADFELNTMTAPYGIDLPAEGPLCHFSARQDVVVWALEPVS
jgi:uncharacterized protein YqjF (DUF2071 family)